MTRLLLDTHTVLWWLADDPSLSPTARDAIADPNNEPLISSASIWEIAIKRALGKLVAPDDLPDRITEQGLQWLAILPGHAWQVRGLPAHHSDPFDRILIAQALVEKLAIVTIDARFSDYGIDVRW
jgi:PIN domain nuclease of toxin-antitoxin system